MADDFQEKTEEASPRKLEEARKKGQVAKSNDLTMGSLLLVAVLTLYFALPYIYTRLQLILYQVFNHLYLEIDSIEVVSYWFQAGMVEMMLIMLPLFLVLFVTAFAVLVLQVGLFVSLESLQMKWKMINIFDVSNYKKYFSPKSFMRVMLGILRTIAIGFISWYVISSQIGEISKAMNGSPAEIISCLLYIAFRLSLIIALMLFILGAFDWFYQRFIFFKEMRMSKQEIKDERRQSEGDVQTKSKMRSMLQSFLRSRIKTQVPKADVIITNPIHYAIAIRYDAKAMAAPICLAKGSRKIALKIKELAKEHNVPIVENPPLARSLYKAVEVGQYIPPQFFHSIAEVLAYVYKLSEKAKIKSNVNR